MKNLRHKLKKAKEQESLMMPNQLLIICINTLPS